MAIQIDAPNQFYNAANSGILHRVQPITPAQAIRPQTPQTPHDDKPYTIITDEYTISKFDSLLQNIEREYAETGKKLAELRYMVNTHILPMERRGR